jgi:RNA polymerase sigma-70 factor (ECF subfamily)
MAITATQFEALYRTNAAYILGYLRRRGAGDDAQDLLSETFLTAWRRREALPAPELQRAWLFSTARRLRLAHQRRHQPTSPVTDAAAAPSRGTDADAVVDAAVHAALARLNEADRELLTLTIWEGLSPSEAAATIGLTAAAGRVRLHRARRRLASDPTLAVHFDTRHNQDGPAPERLAIVHLPG